MDMAQKVERLSTVWKFLVVVFENQVHLMLIKSLAHVTIGVMVGASLSCR
jgi:hypothetical protein